MGYDPALNLLLMGQYGSQANQALENSALLGNPTALSGQGLSSSTPTGFATDLLAGSNLYGGNSGALLGTGYNGGSLQEGLNAPGALNYASSLDALHAITRLDSLNLNSTNDDDDDDDDDDTGITVY